MTREDLIAKVQDVARRRGTTTLSSRLFTQEAHVSTYMIARLFETWCNLCAAAGIEAHARRVALTEEEIFREMRKTFLQLGGIPSLAAFERASKYSRNAFARHGWSWTLAKINFHAWASKNHPEFPYLDQLESGTASPALPRAPRRHIEPSARYHLPFGSRLMGDPLGFGAMANAPVNEMGVIALFAMVAERLGYSLDLFNPSFPDCEARRRVSGNRWERVRIEFEFRSSNFLDHRHERTGCEVLVCWIADWRPDDIEVLELRTVVEALRAQAAARPKRKAGSDEESDKATAESDEQSDERSDKRAGRDAGTDDDVDGRE